MKNYSENYGTTILAKGIEVSNDTRETGLNNNCLVVGASGAGKSTSFCIPNILNITGSFVCADTKGNLVKKLSPSLRKKDYNIYCLDLKDLLKSDGYNPLAYIRRNKDGSYREQDILRLAATLCPIPEESKDPFWLQQAQSVISGTIALVLETLPESEHNLVTVSRITKKMSPLTRYKDGSYVECPMLDICEGFKSAHRKNRDSLAYRQYLSFTQCVETNTTFGCILEHVSAAIGSFDITEFRSLFDNKNRVIDLHSIGKRKTAVFVNISDTSPEMYSIANIFYTQLFQTLCDVADRSPGYRLPVPTRIFLDDFANNVQIPSFDKIISVIRSREISASVILQSLSQLETLYSPSASQTIINNCDSMVFIGGTNDLRTANFLSARLNVPLEKILELPTDKVYVVRRSKKAVLADRILPTDYTLPEEDEAPAKQGVPDTAENTAETLRLTVSYRLLSATNINGGNIQRFSFTSGWMPSGAPIYSSILLNADQISDGGPGKLTIDLGLPGKRYSLKTGNTISGHMTAQTVYDTFNANRSRYNTALRDRA